MNSVPNPKKIDPHDVAVAAIAQACEQLGRADGQFATVDERVFKSEQDAARHSSDQQMRPAVPNRRSLRGRRALQGLVGLLLAVCVCVAAFAWQSPYDHAAKLITARWAPQHVSTSPVPVERKEVLAQPIPPTVGVATADPAVSQPVHMAQSTPQDAAPAAAPMPPELAQWLQAVARDVANMEQGIEQLKASHAQMVRENAELAEQLKAVQAQMARDKADAAEQLKASQEQVARLIAKASEQSPRPKTSALAPRPVAAPKRKPVPTLPSPQARAQPQAPMQSQPGQQ